MYLDTSAWVKLFVPEAESEELDGALRGRGDLVVSDLTITETVSALTRRSRAGSLSAGLAQRLYNSILEQVETGVYLRAELSSKTHREAERLLLSMQSVPLRAGDALHLALALAAGARTMVTFDKRLAEAARRVGLASFP